MKTSQADERVSSRGGVFGPLWKSRGINLLKCPPLAAPSAMPPPTRVDSGRRVNCPSQLVRLATKTESDLRVKRVPVFAQKTGEERGKREGGRWGWGGGVERQTEAGKTRDKGMREKEERRWEGKTTEQEGRQGWGGVGGEGRETEERETERMQGRQREKETELQYSRIKILGRSPSLTTCPG